jgi:hypothetical protein
MKGGHFFPEENPDDTAIMVRRFPFRLDPFGSETIDGTLSSAGLDRNMP